MSKITGAKSLAIPLLLAVLVGCSDTSAFHYDYQGRLLETNGRPAVGLKVFAEDPIGLDDYPYYDDHWKYWGTTTDPQGKFAGTFNNGHGETYSKWLSLIPTPPPAAELDAVYVAVNRNGKWERIFVKLDHDCQKRTYEGGRHIDLPSVVATQPRSQTH